MLLPEAARREVVRSAGTPCSIDGRSSRPDGSTIHCILRDGFEPVIQGDRTVSARAIRVRFTREDFADARSGAVVEVDGVEYLVQDVEPDALGWTHCSLLTT